MKVKSETKIILNESKKVRNKVDKERRPETSSDRGGTPNTSRRTGAVGAQTFTETKL
jgi:hypothetical protein